MKRKFSWILLTALLLLNSCGGTAGTVGTADSVSDTETEAEPVDPLMPTDKKDFDGREFVYVTSSNLKFICAEEETGNKTNDAMWYRDRNTEEALNCKVTPRYSGDEITTIYAAVQASVMAGDADYDLVVNHVNWELTSYVANNLVLDWNTVPYVNFDKPYWNSDIINSLSINGKSPYAASDMYVYDTVFLVYNKKLAADMQLGSLYDYVYDGTWTWDKLMELSTAVAGDINGDNVMDINDRYGVLSNCAGSSWLLRNIPGSCGIYIYQNGKDGIELSLNVDKVQTILEKACAIFNGGGGLIVNDSQYKDKTNVIFGMGNILTAFESTLNAAYNYNDLSFDYGVLPLPKYDEKQDGYISLSWSHNMLIPTTATPEFSGMVCEWLSYYGNKLLRPAFYDTLMSVRFAQDAETVDMLDIIFNSVQYDSGMNFKSQRFYDYFDGMVKQNNTGFSSIYNSALTSEKAYIDNLNNSFTNFGK